MMQQLLTAITAGAEKKCGTQLERKGAHPLEEIVST